MKTHINLGCCVITSPLTLLAWLIVCYIIFYVFAAAVMLGGHS